MVQKKRINLLPKDVEYSEKLRFLKKTSFLVLGVYLFLLFALLGVTFYFFQTESKLASMNESLKQEVDQYRNKEGLLLTIADRVGLSKSIYGLSNTGSIEMVNDIMSLFPSGVEVASVGSKQSGSGIVVAGRTSSSTALKETLDRIKGKQFNEAWLQNFSLGEGGYNFSLDIR